jgi:hypothetical protein
MLEGRTLSFADTRLACQRGSMLARREGGLGPHWRYCVIESWSPEAGSMPAPDYILALDKKHTKYNSAQRFFVLINSLHIYDTV